MAAVLGIFVWQAWSGIPPFAGRTSPKQAVPPLIEPCRNNLADGGQQGGEEEEDADVWGLLISERGRELSGLT